jgi:hypothetical protein
VRFRDEPVLCGGFVVEGISSASCRVRLASCVESCPGEEISVPVAAGDAEWVRQLRPGQFVWVLFRGLTPLGLTLLPRG